MTVAEFVKKLEDVPKDFAEELMGVQPIWTNAACRGYMIAALENVGMDREAIVKMMRGLGQAFDELTVEEAEQKWRSF
jgi:hypothetical protein